MRTLTGNFDIVCSPGRVYIYKIGWVDLDHTLSDEKAIEIVLAGHNHLIKKVKPEKPTTEK